MTSGRQTRGAYRWATERRAGKGTRLFGALRGEHPPVARTQTSEGIRLIGLRPAWGRGVVMK